MKETKQNTATPDAGATKTEREAYAEAEVWAQTRDKARERIVRFIAEGHWPEVVGFIHAAAFVGVRIP